MAHLRRGYTVHTCAKTPTQGNAHADPRKCTWHPARPHSYLSSLSQVAPVALVADHPLPHVAEPLPRE